MRSAKFRVQIQGSLAVYLLVNNLKSCIAKLGKLGCKKGLVLVTKKGQDCVGQQHLSERWNSQS